MWEGQAFPHDTKFGNFWNKICGQQGVSQLIFDPWIKLIWFDKSGAWDKQTTHTVCGHTANPSIDFAFNLNPVFTMLGVSVYNGLGLFPVFAKFKCENKPLKYKRDCLTVSWD